MRPKNIKKHLFLIPNKSKINCNLIDEKCLKSKSIKVKVSLNLIEIVLNSLNINKTQIISKA